MSTVFVTHRLPGQRFQALAAESDVTVWMGPGLLSREALLDEMAEAEGLLCLLTDRVDAAVLDAAPMLRFIASMSVGVDHIDVTAATARGIPVGHTPGVLAETTADACFALLLAAARRVAEGDRFIRAGHWRSENPWSPDFFVGKDVAGATLGIIGLGEIGQAVARRAAGFGMRILGWNRSERDIPGIEQIDLETLLRESDFVSINVALAEETRHLLDRDRLALMKHDAVLVNTARGGIVDEDALFEALAQGRLAAAGLDVFEREPVAGAHPLLSLANVVATPHIGSATLSTRARMADMAVENLLAAFSGRRMPHCVNPEVYD
jgi:glyoxylate reductase